MSRKRGEAMNKRYPETMRAASIQKYGKQEKVTVGEVATPALRDALRTLPVRQREVA